FTLGTSWRTRSPTPKGKPSSSAKLPSAAPASACWKNSEPNPASITCRPQIVNIPGRMRERSLCKLTWGGIHEHSRGQTYSPDDGNGLALLCLDRIACRRRWPGARGLRDSGQEGLDRHRTARPGVVGYLYFNLCLLGGRQQRRHHDLSHPS